MNAAALVLERGANGDVALVCGAHSRTYAETRDAVARAAGAWLEYGLKPGECIAVQIPDGFAWVDAFLGCVWAGGVAVGISSRLAESEWASMTALGEFRFVLVEDPAAVPAAFRERVIGVTDWQRRQALAAAVEARPCEPTDPAIWVHSSGSSGQPKAIVHVHGFVRDIERISVEVVGVEPCDRILATSRMFFSYPQTNVLYAGLMLGASIVLDPAWPTTDGVVRTVEQTRPTVFYSNPAFYRNLLRDSLAADLARAGIRRFVSGGEVLSVDLRQQWREQTGTSIINGYGCSETMVMVLTDRDDGAGLRASPGIRVDPLDAAGTGPVRLCFSASSIALGYRNRPGEQADCFRGGRFCPNDLFEQESNGSWRFAGRESSLVKIFGRWVDLVALEEKFATIGPGISEAAAVVVPDEDGVDAVALFYVPGNLSDDDRIMALLQAAAEEMPPFKRPRWFHMIEQLPRTVTGKLARNRLREFCNRG